MQIIKTGFSILFRHRLVLFTFYYFLLWIVMNEIKGKVGFRKSSWQNGFTGDQLSMLLHHQLSRSFLCELKYVVTQYFVSSFLKTFWSKHGKCLFQRAQKFVPIKIRICLLSNCGSLEINISKVQCQVLEYYSTKALSIKVLPKIGDDIEKV